MSLKPRTIDNLGIEASVRYAKDKELFEPLFLEESRIVSQKTEIPALSPYIASDLEELFATTSTSIWASFEPPPNFNFFKPLFTHQIIPSMGGYEKQEQALEKIEGIEDALQKDKRRGKRKGFDSSEEDHDEKERKTLVSFFQCMQKLDKTLAFINSRRNQYQKG